MATPAFRHLRRMTPRLPFAALELKMRGLPFAALELKMTLSIRTPVATFEPQMTLLQPFADDDERQHVLQGI